MPETVDDILNRPFSSRTLDEKLKIVAEGKPRPFLKIYATLSVNETNGEVFLTHQFNPSMYDEIQWLTGCEFRNAFFCWPCLLFIPPSGMWNNSGIADQAILMEDLHKHEELVDHISATLNLQNLVEQINEASGIVGVMQYNNRVKRNREILRRLTDILCNLLVKKRPDYEQKNGCQIDPDDCVRNLLFLQTYDALNCSYIKEAIGIIKMSPNIIHDLVDTLAKIVKLAIRREIHSSTYVSIILTNHSKMAHKSQISTVLRYIKDGRALEKFTGFLNMGDKKNLPQVLRHIANTINEFGLSEKLISVSLDGGILPTNQLVELMDGIKEAYPYTFLVPWYCHSTKYVLLKSLAKIKECSAFLKAIGEMKLYFHKKSERFKCLQSFMTSNHSSIRNRKWFTRTQLVNDIRTYRKYFVEFFEWVSQNSTMWTADDLAKASGFRHFLEDFQTVFLLEVFARVIDVITPLTDCLKEYSYENYFSSIVNCAVKVVNQLREDRDTKFEIYWTSAMKEKRILLPISAQEGIEINDPEISKFKDLYRVIFDCVLDEIAIRYLKLAKLTFCKLLSDKPVGRDGLSDLLHLLISAHGAHFDEEQTRNELTVLRRNNKTLPKKSVSDLLLLFMRLELKNVFKNSYKMAEFVLTLPAMPPSQECDESKLDEINFWSYIPEVLGVPTGDVSIPCVEIDFFRELKKSSTFYSDVVVVFYDANKTFELLPK